MVSIIRYSLCFYLPIQVLITRSKYCIELFFIALYSYFSYHIVNTIFTRYKCVVSQPTRQYHDVFSLNVKVTLGLFIGSITKQIDISANANRDYLRFRN